MGGQFVVCSCTRLMCGGGGALHGLWTGTACTRMQPTALSGPFCLSAPSHPRIARTHPPARPTVLPQHNKHERWDEEKDKAAARRKFVALDTNGDGKLDASELRAAFNDLHPNERR